MSIPRRSAHLDKDAALWVRRKVSADRAVVYDGRRVLSEHFEVAP